MKPKLGETEKMLGRGMARKAGKSVIQANKRKKRRLDNIMSQIRSGRKAQ